MHEPMMSWLARRPSLIDNAGAPVLSASPSIPLIEPHAADANQPDLLRDSPTQPIAEDLRGVLIARGADAPQLALLFQAPPR